MSDKAILVVLLYMIGSVGLGILIGKGIRWRQTGSWAAKCDAHEWQPRGYGGAGWTLYRCIRCGETMIDS